MGAELKLPSAQPVARHRLTEAAMQQQTEEPRLAFCPACFVEVTPEQAGEQINAARVLAEFAKTAPGRLPQRVQDAIAVVASPPSPTGEEGKNTDGVVAAPAPRLTPELARRIAEALDAGCVWAEGSEGHARMVKTKADFDAWRADGVPGASENGKRSTSAATASGHELPDDTAVASAAASLSVANGGNARVASAGRPSGVEGRTK